MRELTDHIVSGDQAVQLNIRVTDEPGAGGANHAYHINWQTDISDDPTTVAINHLAVHFQEGPIKEFGVNGITHEALLAILIDRMKSFQAGPYSCHDNECALVALQEALMRLQKRTKERITRGVEGTHEK